MRVPWFLDLGLAPPPPRGATALAPRVAAVTSYSIHDAYPRVVRGFTPLVMLSYVLPVGAASPGGPPFQAPRSTRLLPNPYQVTGG